MTGLSDTFAFTNMRQLDALVGISNDELRDAFLRISDRLAREVGKPVHPASVVEKLTGEMPEWY